MGGEGDSITPPLWKRPRHATGTRNGKTEEENHKLSSAIHAGRDKIVPLDELSQAILPEVPLANVANDKIDPDRGVDSDYEVAHVPEDDGQVQVAPNPLLREDFVHDVKWDRKEEAEEISSQNPLVALSKCEHFQGHSPCDAVRIDGLNIPKYSITSTIEINLIQTPTLL